jgi:hypothetical protein
MILRPSVHSSDKWDASYQQGIGVLKGRVIVGYSVGQSVRSGFFPCHILSPKAQDLPTETHYDLF